MKGFKRCEKGHFYKDTLSECNYCPSSGKATNSDETELINQTTNETEKTQVFAQPGSSSKKENFDPEKTMIAGAPSPMDSAEDGAIQQVQKRKLRGWLVSYDIEEFGVDFKIIEGRNTIGKGSSNDITIQDNLISSLQGIILCRNDKFILTDEVSTNGTFLNGKELVPRDAYEINDGDEIKVGDTTLLFRIAFKK